MPQLSVTLDLEDAERIADILEEFISQTTDHPLFLRANPVLKHLELQIARAVRAAKVAGDRVQSSQPALRVAPDGFPAVCSPVPGHSRVCECIECRVAGWQAAGLF